MSRLSARLDLLQLGPRFLCWGALPPVGVVSPRWCCCSAPSRPSPLPCCCRVCAAVVWLLGPSSYSVLLRERVDRRRLEVDRFESSAFRWHLYHQRPPVRHFGNVVLLGFHHTFTVQRSVDMTLSGRWDCGSPLIASLSLPVAPLSASCKEHRKVQRSGPAALLLPVLSSPCSLCKLHCTVLFSLIGDSNACRLRPWRPVCTHTIAIVSCSAGGVASVSADS